MALPHVSCDFAAAQCSVKILFAMRRNRMTLTGLYYGLLASNTIPQYTVCVNRYVRQYTYFGTFVSPARQK